MTATMPEEDVEVAVEKAEGCHGWIREECSLLATVECLIECPTCGQSFRRAYCDPHFTTTVRHCQESSIWAMTHKKCGGNVHISAVLPL